jgi:RNA polymerase sigma-70 factor (ECF subfamily)
MLKTTGLSVTSDVALCIPALRAVSRSLTGDRERADGFVEDVIIRLLTDPQPAPPGIKLRVWMLAILHNLHRAESSRADVATQSTSDGIGKPVMPSNVAAGLASDDFRRAFWGLSDGEREVLILEEASGMSREEVATVCGCTTSLIASRLSWARQKLVRALDHGDQIELVAPPRGSIEMH